MNTKNVTRGLMTAVALFLAGCTSGPTTVDHPKVDCTLDPTNAACHCQNDAICTEAGKTRCDTGSGTCVECLPGPSDNCASGKVCGPDFTCKTACATNAECVKLSGDSNSQCCGGLCVNEATDVNNCGACGNKCGDVSNGTSGCAAGYCIIKGCNDGFADCDLAILDGCEVQTSTDALNCGGCGMVCMPEPNGVPACTNSMCSTSCAAGYVDCNANIADGCEVDTTGDPMNCGSCGKACSAPAHSDPACDGSKCSFRCKLGYADCNGNAADGCETSVGADVQNCGHCGNICPVLPNSSGATCSAGLCASDCNAGFGDCDAITANGCESDTASDMANCGGCGMLCSTLNTSKASCAMGVCTIACNKNFGDCNMDVGDGCESDFNRDPMNCGGCGNACPPNMQYCNNAKCTNVFPAPTACTSGKDQELDGTYTVCGGADQNQATFGSTNGGSLHPDQICKFWGYVGMDQFGNEVGEIGSQCHDFVGWQFGWSCGNPQMNMMFDSCPVNFIDGLNGDPDGCAVTGNDMYGIIVYTGVPSQGFNLGSGVVWTCLR